MSKMTISVVVGAAIGSTFTYAMQTSKENIAALGNKIKELNARKIKVGVEAFLKIYLFNLQFLLFFSLIAGRANFIVAKTSNKEIIAIEITSGIIPKYFPIKRKSPITSKPIKPPLHNKTVVKLLFFSFIFLFFIF